MFAAQSLYLTLKSCHIISFISWMAGLLYLPRLFVYHVDAVSTETRRTFEIMEKKLYRIIILPAFIMTFSTGFCLSLLQESWLKPYFYVKMFCILCLTMFQFSMGCFRIDLAQGTCRRGAAFFRFANEVPTILIIIISFCVVFKPFQ